MLDCLVEECHQQSQVSGVLLGVFAMITEDSFVNFVGLVSNRSRIHVRIRNDIIGSQMLHCHGALFPTKIELQVIVVKST